MVILLSSANDCSWHRTDFSKSKCWCGAAALTPLHAVIAVSSCYWYCLDQWTGRERNERTMNTVVMVMMIEIRQDNIYTDHDWFFSCMHVMILIHSILTLTHTHQNCTTNCYKPLRHTKRNDDMSTKIYIKIITQNQCGCKARPPIRPSSLRGRHHLNRENLKTTETEKRRWQDRDCDNVYVQE